MSSAERINPDSPESPLGNTGDLFKPKRKPTAIRVLTVLAYVLSVSMAAILLSIYYIFIWEGKPHIGARTSRGVKEFHNGTDTVEHITKEMNASIYKEQIEGFVNNSSDIGRIIIHHNAKNFTTDVENSEQMNNTYLNRKMQQQIEVSNELEDLVDIDSTTPTTSTDTSTFWSEEDFDSVEELKGQVLIKKLMSAYPYDGPD